MLTAEILISAALLLMEVNTVLVAVVAQVDLALDAMAINGAVTQEEVDKLTQEHLENLIKLRDRQMGLVSSARGSTTFLEDLQSLLADHTRFHITGWPALEGVEGLRNSRSLGFYTPKCENVLFIDMNLAYAAVAEYAGRSKVSVKNKSHILRQLLDDKVIIKELCEKDRNSCRRKNLMGQFQKVSPIRAEALGFTSITSVKPEPIKKTDFQDEKIALD